MNYFRNIIILLLVVVFAGCGGKPDAASAKKPGAKGVTQRDVPVIIKPLAQQNLPDFITITGTVQGETDVQMSSETSGRVVAVNKTLGDWVEAGEEIGRVDNKDYALLVDQANAALLAAEAGFEASGMSWKTSQDLYAQKTIAPAEFAVAKSTYKQSQANLDAARARLEQAQRSYDNSRFIAPVSGFVAYIALEVGERIAMGSSVCTLVNTKKMLINTGISEQDVRKVVHGDKVDIFYDEDTFTGIIEGVGKKPLAGTLLYPVEISLKNHDDLLYPGMAVSIKIATKVYKDVIAISQNLILKQYDTDYVFVIQSDDMKTGKAIRRTVTRRKNVGENSIISGGLAAGDLLVMEGAENLEDGNMVVIRQVLEP